MTAIDSWEAAGLTGPSTEHLVLVHAAALGDTLLLGPMLQALARRFPQARITLVSRYSFGQLLKKLGWIDDFHSIESPWCWQWYSDPPEKTNPPPNPPWESADLLISCVAGESDPWISAARRWGRARAVRVMHPRPPVPYTGHVTEFHRRQLADLELLEPPPVPRRSNPAGAVMIHPGSGGVEKCWPLEHFRRLAASLQQRGMRCHWILGEAELERWTSAQIESLGTQVSIAPDLPALADLLSSARGYVGNDSGPTHLAGAMGLPTWALFGPSDPEIWRPIGPSVQLLVAPDRRQMGSLSVEMVSEYLAREGF